MPPRTPTFRSVYARMFLVICVAAVPILAGLAHFLWQQQQSLLQLARHNAEQYVDLAARHEHWAFRSAEETLAALANTPALQQADWPACDRFLSRLLQVPGSRYINFGVIGLDGQVLCNARAAPSGGMPWLGDRAYFQRALQQDGAVIGEYQVGRIIGAPTLAVALALRNGAGALQGVVYATLRLDVLAAEGLIPTSADGQELAVTDREGTILFESGSALGAVGDPLIDSAVWRLARTPAAGVQTLKGIDGETWLVAARSVGLAADERALHVIHRVPLDAVLGPIRTDMMRSGLAMLALILLALLAGWAGTHMIMGRNVRLLTQAARRLRQREYGLDVTPQVSGQEFREIASQIDHMAAELRHWEAQWQRTLQRQRCQADVLEHIAQGGELRRTLELLAEGIEAQAEGSAVSIVLAASPDSELPACVAPSLSPAWCRALQDVGVDALHDGGVDLGAHETRRVVCNDIASDPRWEPIRGIALEQGLRAYWSVPILSPGGRVLGIFALIFRQRPSPDAALMQLAESAADLVALAIESDRTRLALTQSEAEYRYLFETNPNAMWVVEDSSGHILAVNDEALALYGYQRSECLALNTRDVEVASSPASPEVLSALGMDAGALEPGARHSVRRHRRKDGSEIVVHLVSAPINFRGREARVVLVQDMTEQTLLRQGIRERDELFTLLMESTVEAICGVDADGRCTFANQAFQQLLGYGEDELIGEELHHLIHARHEDGRDYPLHQCPVRRAMQERQAIRRDDEVFWRKDGTALPVEYWVYPLQRHDHSTGAIVTFLDVTERRRQRDVLNFRASHDGLTGLLNRSGFTQSVESALHDLTPRERLALFLLDLDGFKEVNDSLGHQVGDELLMQLASRIPVGDSNQCAVARVGGDEFAVLLRLPAHASRAQPFESILMAHASLLLARIREPVVLDDIELQVSGSIGIACYPEHGRNLVELMRQADIAMYDAKRGGTGFAFSDPARAQHDTGRLLLMTQLRQAIDRHELELYYQPKFRLVDQQLVGYEALVRWLHPERGLLLPALFVPALEVSDLIHPFTEWVLEQAVIQLKSWQQEGRDVSVAVNISARNLMDAALPDKVARILATHQVSAGLLELEITESSVMTDPTRSLEVLSRLHRIGVGIAIDDFGTGYSSLAYLQRLPVQNLKIDRSFVHELAQRAEARKIVAAIIGLAHSLDVKVTAEGIEDAEALALLRTLRCDEGQGFYLGRPAPPSAAGT